MTRAIDIHEVPEAFRPFAAPLLERPDAAERLVGLLGTLGQKAAPKQAAAFALLLRRALPADARMRQVTESFLRDRYPAWYIRAVNDSHRNAAYRAAIEAAVGPGSVVLELGTGSGLFAMMAAQAGAAHVYTCERDAGIRALAAETIRRNGYADRITQLGDYKEIAPGTLPRPADVLIHEFVGPQWLTRGMTSLAQELGEGLLAPGAAVLPRHIGIRAMLVADDASLVDVRIGAAVEGFDLAAMNALALPGLSRRGPFEPLALSAPETVAEHDLATGGDPSGERVIRFEVTGDGTATGVLQWVRHRFPGGAVYENTPDRRCNWQPMFWAFAGPMPVTAGDALAVRCRTTATEVFFDPLP